MKRSERGNAEAGTNFQIHAVGQPHSVRRWQRNVLRGRSKCAAPGSIPEPDALADTRASDARAHRVDDAGSVAVRNDSWKRECLGSRPGPGLDVGGINAGPGDL